MEILFRIRNNMRMSRGTADEETTGRKSTMARLKVLTFPNPLLAQVSQPVTEFGPELEKLSQDMLETMYEENGIGLAAPQVGQLRRMVVVDVGGEQEEEALEGDLPPDRPPDPHVYINPVILEKAGETTTEEGCLSVIEFTAQVKRAEQIVLTYQDLKGKEHRVELDGLHAVCVQHELDHLEGKLFIDHLPPIKRQMVRKRLAKLGRTA